MLAHRKTTAIVAGGLAALALAAVIALAADVRTANARGGCANATAQPGEATNRQLRNAVICLINDKRRARGIGALSRNGKLNRAARKHTRVMLAQDCFRHKCAGEPSIKRRLRRVGYLKGRSWRFGEGIGYDQTPRKMMNAFLDSRYHRRLIFDRRFEDIGAAAKRGAPVRGVDDDAVVTYTFDLGTP